jgi:hypothetical protein
MQQKTDGRVVRLLTKHLSAEDRSVEQWFLVAIGDDDKAKDAVIRSTNASEELLKSLDTSRQLLSPVGVQRAMSGLFFLASR